MMTMTMEEIKNPSSMWVGPLGAVKVEKILPAIHAEIESYPEMYALLTSSMETNGQRVPVYIAYPDKVARMLAGGPVLADGIHRVAIAEVLGWETMTTSDKRVTCRMWDESIAGRRYRYLREERLGLDKR